MWHFQASFGSELSSPDLDLCICTMRFGRRTGSLLTEASLRELAVSELRQAACCASWRRGRKMMLRLVSFLRARFTVRCDQAAGSIYTGSIMADKDLPQV